MKKHYVIGVYSIFLLMLGMGLAPLAESATQSATEAQLLTGNTWQTLSRDNKIAYIWGIGNLVELERTNLESQQLQPPADDRKSFIPYLDAMICPACQSESLMIYATLAPKVELYKSFWHNRWQCKSYQRMG